jgi:hypothetical protein
MLNKKLQKLLEELVGEQPAEEAVEAEGEVAVSPEQVEQAEVEAVADEAKAELASKESEYGEEGSMAISQLKIIADAAGELESLLHDDTDLPEWVQSKITLAKEYIDTARDYIKAEAQEEAEEHVEVEQAFTGEELMEAFVALGLDTKKYTLEYLAEQLGFIREELGTAAAQPVATKEGHGKSLKVGLSNAHVYPEGEHKQTEEVKEVIIEGVRGRPSAKSKRMAPKGSTVVGTNGKLETIKKLQKK